MEAYAHLLRTGRWEVHVPILDRPEPHKLMEFPTRRAAGPGSQAPEGQGAIDRVNMKYKALFLRRDSAAPSGGQQVLRRPEASRLRNVGDLPLPAGGSMRYPVEPGSSSGIGVELEGSAGGAKPGLPGLRAKGIVASPHFLSQTGLTVRPMSTNHSRDSHRDDLAPAPARRWILHRKVVGRDRSWTGSADPPDRESMPPGSSPKSARGRRSKYFA